jgi:PKD repeat protein
MNRYVIFAVTMMSVSPVMAGIQEHRVSINSPTENSCINNGDQIGTGGIIGGEAASQPRDVPLNLTIRSADGQNVTLTVLSEWTEEAPDGNLIDRSETYQIIVSFPADEIIVTTDDYPIPGFFIGDGQDVRVTIRSEHPVFELDEDSVIFDLDREAPQVVMTPEQLGAAQSQCSATPDAFAYEVEDNRTPPGLIQSSIREDRIACTIRRIVTVRDNCGSGNAQEYELSNQAPAAAGDLTIALMGYECTVDECVTHGPNAVTFEDNARVSRATIVPVIGGEPGCATSISTTLMQAGRQVEACPAAPPHVFGPAGNECVEDEECNGAQNCTNGYCAEPEECINDADCREGRFCGNSSCRSPCFTFESGRAIEVAGDYIARTIVSSCGEDSAEATLRVTVLEKPVARPGGNLPNGDYQVAQGAGLILDGSQSTGAEEVGGIIQYAWDLNRDGFFDPDEEVFDGEEPTATFPTHQSGTFRIRMRVTAGNGATDYTWFNIIVDDVSPVCDAGGPYEVSEGQSLRFDGSASIEGHASEPIAAYRWEFGDGFRPQEGASLETPLHIYGDANAEPFVVTLTVSDQDSSASCSALVTVTDVLPQLDGIEVLNPQAAVEGSMLRFEARAQAGSQSDPLTNFAWTFGPLAAQAEGPAMRVAEWLYTDDGEYTVCVTVQDEDSSVNQCTNIIVADLEPVAFFEGPLEGRQGDELTFDAGNTRPGGMADPLTQIVWNWGDGSNLQPVALGPNMPNQFVHSHTFAQDGDFTVTLRVIDEDSASIFQRQVHIADAEPTAAVHIQYPTAERSVAEGQPLLLSGAGSEAGSATDPIVTYRWDFGDGTPIRELAANQPGVSHEWADEGVYEVRLTVIDIDGSESTDMAIVEVTNAPPTVELQIAEDLVAIGQNIQFAAISGDIPDGPEPRVLAVVGDVSGDLPPALVRWEMGDGSVIESGSHRYAYNTLGPKTIRVTIGDGDGGTTEAELRITVTPAAPDIEVVETQHVREGETLSFEILVEAPATGPGMFDMIAVNSIEWPIGSEIEYIEEGNDIRVRFNWTPTFYDSGNHRLWLRATTNTAERLRIIDIEVAEAGVPRIAATSGTSSRGVLTFYDYERGARSVVLRSTPEIELGLGAGALSVTPDGRHVWITVPGSNRVAVVSTAGQGELIRRIPVGAMPSALVYGDGYFWVANQLDSSISIIDSDSMKIVTTFEIEGATRPTDLVWLPSSNAEPARLLVVTESGHLVVLDAEQARVGGIEPVLITRQLGGLLSRIVMDEAADSVYVADSKTRQIYQLALSSIEDPAAAVTGFSLDFAARDLLAESGRLWVATEMNLIEYENGDTQTHSFVRARALAKVNEQAVTGGAIAVATGNRIENYRPEGLERITDAAGSRLRRIITLVAPR